MTSFFVIALVLALGIANFARQRYEVALQRGRRPSPLPQTAAEIAREFLDSFDAADVRIVEHNGFISDYFDPKRKCLFLHRDVMNGKTDAAWAIALHEAAHAAQMRGMMTALDMRIGNIRLTRYAPALAGLLIVVLGIMKRPPLGIGWKILAVIWAVIMLLNALSLPIEFHASKLARAFLERKFRKNPDALENLDLVLSGVAWRDTAVFLRSPMYCFYALLPVGGRMRPRGEAERGAAVLWARPLHLIPVHLRINPLGPGIDAAIQVGDVAVAVTAQPHGGVVGPHPVVAIHNQRLVVIRQPLWRFLHEPRKRNQFRTLDVADGKLILLPHIDEAKAERGPSACRNAWSSSTLRSVFCWHADHKESIAHRHGRADLHMIVKRLRHFLRHSHAAV